MKPAALILAFSLVFMSHESRAADRVSGTWEWIGAAGWQRVVLTLKADGKDITGSMRLGPSPPLVSSPDRYWEYFFEPAVFPISKGRIDGNTISFEQAGRLVYRGTVAEDQIHFVREASAAGIEAFFIGTHRVEFTVRRAGSTSDVRSPAIQLASPPRKQSQVGIDFAVEEADGQPVTNLTAADIEVLEDGVQRPIVDFTPLDDPWNCMLLFDHNITWLRGDPRQNSPNFIPSAWTALLQASNRFLDQLGPKHRAAVATFEQKPLLAIDWTGTSLSGRSVALPLAQPPAGQKDMYGSLRWAVNQFGTSKGHKIMVVFTDGRDGRLSPLWLTDPVGREVMDPLFGLSDLGEAEEFQQALAAIRSGGVRVYFIAVNTTRDPEFGPAVIPRRISGLYPGANEAIFAYQSRVRFRMESLAEASGGRVFYGNGPEDAVALYLQLTHALRVGKTYSVVFSSSNPSDGAYHSLEIRSPKRDLRIAQSRDGYSSR